MQTYFKRIDRSKDDFSKMLFFTSTKDGHLLESNIFEEKGSQRLLSVSLWTARVLMVVASTHKFKERGVTTVVHCSSGHDHVTYTFFSFGLAIVGSLLLSIFIYIYIYIFLSLFVYYLDPAMVGSLLRSICIACIYLLKTNIYVVIYLYVLLITYRKFSDPYYFLECADAVVADMPRHDIT